MITRSPVQAVAYRLNLSGKVRHRRLGHHAADPGMPGFRSKPKSGPPGRAPSGQRPNAVRWYPSLMLRSCLGRRKDGLSLHGG